MQWVKFRYWRSSSLANPTGTKIFQYTLTGNFITPSRTGLGCLYSVSHRLNKLLEGLLRASYSCFRFGGCRDFDCCKFIVMFEKPVWHDWALWHEAYSPYHYTDSSSLNCSHKAGWIHVLMMFVTNSDPAILKVAAEIKTHQTREHFSYLLLSNFNELR